MQLLDHDDLESLALIGERIIPEAASLYSRFKGGWRAGRKARCRSIPHLILWGGGVRAPGGPPGLQNRCAGESWQAGSIPVRLRPLHRWISGSARSAPLR